LTAPALSETKKAAPFVKAARLSVVTSPPAECGDSAKQPDREEP
jgi:hypothetical protein